MYTDLCGEGSVPKTCGISVQKTLFAPRAGLAYRIQSKTVVRARGYSLAPEQIKHVPRWPIQLSGDAYPKLWPHQIATRHQPLWLMVFRFCRTQIQAVERCHCHQSLAWPLPQSILFAAIPSPTMSVCNGSLPEVSMAQLGYVGTLTIHQHTRDTTPTMDFQAGGTESQQLYPSFGITAARDRHWYPLST